MDLVDWPGRDAREVLADVEFGVVSEERAKEGYSVVFGADGQVDPAKTEALRKEKRAKRFFLTAAFDPAFKPYIGRKGNRRILQIAPVDAKALGVKTDDLVEILGKNPAPLRAWVVIKEDAKGGTFPIEDFGCKVLGIRNGDRVEIRYLWTPHIPKGMAR